MILKTIWNYIELLLLAPFAWLFGNGVTVLAIDPQWTASQVILELFIPVISGLLLLIFGYFVRKELERKFPRGLDHFKFWKSKKIKKK